ncbi:MAG: RNA-binding protein [Muribaculaceae bacterium]|nr:RNA-binding protein [Muribaculaceae bacterium]
MNIYISNLSYSVKDESLLELFSAFGEVTSAKVITDKFSGRSRGFGFVEMSDDAAGQNAIDQLNNTEFEGRTISVNVAQPREEKPRNFRPRNNNRY